MLSNKPIPAPVLPLHRDFVGAIVVAWAHREELRIAADQTKLYVEHERFFFKARMYIRDSDDLYLIVCGGGATAWHQAHTERTPAGEQYVISGAERERRAELARRQAAAPLKPSRAQEPCNVGLFSDDAAQTDLVELTRK